MNHDSIFDYNRNGYIGPKGECRIKHDRIKKLLEDKNLAGILLNKNSNFSWFTAGRDQHIELAYETGAAQLLVFPDEVLLFSDNIEKKRLLEEEVGDLNFATKIVPWHQKNRELKEIINEKKIGSDMYIPGTFFISEEIKKLRYKLLPPEIDRLKKLGSKTSQILTQICREIKSGITENELAGEISRGLFSEGIRPAVILIGSDRRIYNYRHPVPKDKKIDKNVMAIVCAEKWGLVVSLTRQIYFGELPGTLKKKQDAVRKIDACYYKNTEPGAKIKEIFSSAQKAYREMGFSEEWEKHHQGGAAGYSTRDYLATPGSEKQVHKNQAFAWNPSITGVKSEDTVVLTDEGLEIVTEDRNWPSDLICYEGYCCRRPAIMIK